jgi:hypothetical protein
MMVRKLAISLAAVAVMLAGSTLTAAARFGGGMGHVGGFGHMGGPGHMGGFSRGAFGPGFAHPGSFGRFGAVQRFPFRANRFAFRHHRFFGPRFAFFGATFPYAYDSCYTRVWTPVGWRWTYACYY